MELIKQQTRKYPTINGQVELAVFDLVGQLLAILLEKYDVEIIIESEGYGFDLTGEQKPGEFVKTIIACEEVTETEESIEITLCGEVKCKDLHDETFTLFLSLCLKNNLGDLWSDYSEKKKSIKSLWLQFGRKAEQFSDSIFKVVLVRKEHEGRLQILGEGRGILVFGREKSLKPN